MKLVMLKAIRDSFWNGDSSWTPDSHDDLVCLMQKNPPLIPSQLVNLGSGCWLVMLQNVKCSASAMLTRMIRCVWCEMPLLWCHPSHFVGSPVCATQNEGFCHHHLYHHLMITTTAVHLWYILFCRVQVQFFFSIKQAFTVYILHPGSRSSE